MTWAWLPPMPNRRLKKRERYEAMAERALAHLSEWMGSDVARRAETAVTPA